MERILPSSLFGRLVMLLLLVAVASQFLAFTVMFNLFPRPDFGPMQPRHPGPGGPHPPPGFMVDNLFHLAALMLAAWVAAKWLSKPMRDLALAARELGNNIQRTPLQEVGTVECRETIQVFNQMQQKICAQMQQRDQFVAAVSHDLRTPLTRLKLRVESLADGDERTRFAKDIAEMDNMIRVTLDYLRGASEAEPLLKFDLSTLLASVVEDRQEMGHDVSLDYLTDIPLMQGQMGALRRCVDNLLDNALRYGVRARVAATRARESVHIEVCDDGPGIPDALLTQVTLPFYRVEVSRNRNSGGIGLGLAIVQSIVVQHGGRLVLANRPTGGLKATLELPLAYGGRTADPQASRAAH